MELKSTNVAERDTLKPWIVKEVARMYGVTNDQVYRVMRDNRNNQKIFESYMTILEGAMAVAQKEAMLTAVTRLVPFENLN